MRRILQSGKWVIFCLLVGLVSGLGYYYLIGIDFPQSSLNNNPWFTTGYGLIFGAVVGLIIKDFTDTDRKKSIV